MYDLRAVISECVRPPLHLRSRPATSFLIVATTVAWSGYYVGWLGASLPTCYVKMSFDRSRLPMCRLRMQMKPFALCDMSIRFHGQDSNGLAWLFTSLTPSLSSLPGTQTTDPTSASTEGIPCTYPSKSNLFIVCIHFRISHEQDDMELFRHSTSWAPSPPGSTSPASAWTSGSRRRSRPSASSSPPTPRPLNKNSCT